MHVGVFIYSEGDVPPPAAHHHPHVLPRAFHLVLLRAPGVVGVRAEGGTETGAVPAPAPTPATAPTLGHGNVEDEEASPGDATRELAPAPQIGTEIEEGNTHHAEEPGKRKCMINGLKKKDKKVWYI